ncbi:hypothetical protein DRO69_10845 [Candidatus Bathyarchaeota archaeon]|nr:MAG: hypothetical protein DRO69_10845 [Candidatus Bathyarchaeota archaeon]
MAKTIDIQPSKLVLTDDTTLSAHTIYADNDEIDIDKPIKPDGIKGRASSDLYITATSSQKVGVKDSGGSVLVDIDEDTGIIDFSKQSRMRAYRSGSNQDVGAGASAKVQFNGVSYDEHNEFDEATNYRFTATKAGYYLVQACITYDGTADQVMFSAEIFKNGSRKALARNHASGTSSLSIVLTDVVYLAAGDYIEIYSYNGHTGTLGIAHGEDITYLAIHKLS